MASRSAAIKAFNTPPLNMLCPMRKAPWRTQAEALKEADRLNMRPDGWGKVFPFLCHECGRWHNGRPHKGKTLQ